MLAPLLIVIPLMVEYVTWTGDYLPQRVFTRDYIFPIASGTTMVDSLANLTSDLNAGRTSIDSIKAMRDGGHLAMIYLLAERRGLELDNLPKPDDVFPSSRPGAKALGVKPIAVPWPVGPEARSTWVQHSGRHEREGAAMT